MLGPTVTPTMSGFYPVGNTPPVDVLESIPPGQDSEVLLLGCGDARNLLFTLYCRPSSDQSHLNFTCCDISTEIIARNILLYTLLIDDVDGADTGRIWNIYYHSMLDEDSLHLLQKQARKLADLGITIENWRQQPYGKALRFCDQSTFDRVVKLWTWYALDIKDGPAFEEQQKRLKYMSRMALSSHEKIMGWSCNTSTLRSAAPCSNLVVEHMGSLLPGYWVTGLTDHDAKLIATSTCLNPTFSTMHELSLVYASMEPLQSFHLATAYAPLKKDSPFIPNSRTLPRLNPLAQAATRQFQTWAETFRRAKNRLTIRFTSSDALAFCHVLQHHAVRHNSQGAFQYRDRLRYEQLVLDPVEYRSRLPAENMFDVIDTSNLVDHWGSLNILAACRPLLKPGTTSTIYMELLQLRDESLEPYSKGLLCGDVVTVSLLFGLNPIQFWTNTTTFSSHPETMARSMAEPGTGGQARFIMVWKNANMLGVKFDPDHLARFVYSMYLRMFEHEKPTTQSSKAANRLARIQFPQYTRAGLAVILSLIKDANFVDFTVFLERLHACLSSGLAQEMPGSQYAQSLDLHLHEFGLCTPTIHSENIENAQTLEPNPFRNWLDMSSTVYLSVAVPHSKWLPLLFIPKPDTWPLFQLSLRLPNLDRGSHFADVQIGFGVIRTRGTRHTSSYAVEIETDEREMEPPNLLIVSALIPACILLEHLRSSTVAIQFMPRTHEPPGARAVPESVATDVFRQAITAHTASLDDESVFVTQNPPNMKGRMLCPYIPGALMWKQPVGTADTGKVSFHMMFDQEATRVEKLTLHIDLSSTNAEPLLQSKDHIEFKLLSSFVLELNIGSGSKTFRQQIRLPVSLTTSGSRTKIARRSAYVEFIATIAAPDVLSTHPDSLYPMSLVCGKPILENVGYICLEQLPTVDVSDTSKVEWMYPHLMSMLSPRELEVADSLLDHKLRNKDPRFNFKQMLINVFTRYAGLAGKKQQNAFGLTRYGETVPLIMVFISSLRLDLASLSVTIDAAMLPSTAKLEGREVRDLLTQMENKATVFHGDDATLALWKYAAAAFAERCRDWEHTATCEYALPSPSIVPTADADGNILCSCGLGKFPRDYKPDVPVWESVAKYCVRVAIPPSYSVPLVERVIPDFGSFDIYGKIANLDPKKQGCWGCNGHVSESQKLLKCGGCKVAQYCSKACQVKDWKQGRHKLVCKAMKLSV
ncbi:uncharacterized protein PV07_03095 [Cladophialophora immunda]|uniref:MYND-type domain-containing protein n=1 Tax=Cladophialophora immunda TaxID=569365 RepID=A0A0D2CN51_9EURO|nr:uncharacterized protein PV07_03095 [Cladophialophora immunda]KIW31445.1 hypothetical protein PV07_03095 [Cladophialophora immunda]